MSTAYFLVIHGSREGRSQEGVHQVRDALRRSCPRVLIQGGCLEGQDPSLTEQCANFLSIARQQGYAQGLVIPLFLLAGNHVLQDIPNAIAEVPAPIPVVIADYFGNFPCILPHLEQKFRQAELGLVGTKTARLLICHGSRQELARQRMEQMGDRLGARLALANDPQSIPWQIEQMVAEGIECILALPYFLFAGKTTTAITATVQSYGQFVHWLPLPFSPLEIAEIVYRQIIYPNTAKSGYLLQSTLKFP